MNLVAHKNIIIPCSCISLLFLLVSVVSISAQQRDISELPTAIDLVKANIRLIDSELEQTCSEARATEEEVNGYFLNLKQEPWETTNDFEQRKSDFLLSTHPLALKYQIFSPWLDESWVSNMTFEYLASDAPTILKYKQNIQLIESTSFYIPSDYLTVEVLPFDRESKSWPIKIRVDHPQFEGNWVVTYSILDSDGIAEAYSRFSALIISPAFSPVLCFSIDYSYPDTFRIINPIVNLLEASSTEQAIAILLNGTWRILDGQKYTAQPDSYIEVVEVKGGVFQRDENPQNISIVDSILMGAYEITRSQFNYICGFDPSDPEISTESSSPVQNVSWYQALVFCNLLSLHEGLTPVYSIRNTTDVLSWGDIPDRYNRDWDGVKVDWKASGYRLPTEMEWWWCAMGGDIQKKDQVNVIGYLKKFSGNENYHTVKSAGFVRGNSNGLAHIGGFKVPNELRIYDMTGNVLEWCWDLNTDYDGPFYPDGRLISYTGASSGGKRVLRGSSYSCDEARRPLSYHAAVQPYLSYSNVGFRVVRNINN